MRGRYDQRVAYQNLRKASFLLSELHHTGKVTLCKIPDWGQHEPSPEFADLLRHFCDNANRTVILAGSTVKTARSAIRTFFFELEERGIQSFDGITLSEVSNTITHMAKRYAGGLTSAIFCVRTFLRHLYENNFTQENLSLAIPEMITRRTTFREGFTSGETVRLLDEPNRETDIGKLMPERELFFPDSQGNLYTKVWLDKTFRIAKAKASIGTSWEHSPLPYDFRHTFATHRLYQWMREGKDITAMLPCSETN